MSEIPKLKDIIFENKPVKLLITRSDFLSSLRMIEEILLDFIYQMRKSESKSQKTHDIKCCFLTTKYFHCYQSLLIQTTHQYYNQMPCL